MKTNMTASLMETRLKKYSRGSAGRHETFVPRYGWLTKGYSKCVENPDVFKGDNGVVALGVGKNMVRSIRFWCLFSGLLSLGDKGRLIPTQLGNKLIGAKIPGINEIDWESGWDPYLEDEASLWLLHWQIFTHPEMAVSWPLTFNFLTLQTFSAQELSAGIIKAASDDERLAKLSPNSYKKDAVCLLHMYRPPVDGDGEIHCPFNCLGLIEKTQEKGRFRFSFKERRNLPALIFLAACFSFIEVSKISGQTINLNTIVYANDSPGAAFKLPETQCGKLLDQAVSKFDDLHFVETAGALQLHFSGKPNDWYWRCLAAYYGE